MIGKSLSFIIGAAAGALVGWYVAKKKYEDVANQEMQDRLAKRHIENIESTKKSGGEKQEKVPEQTPIQRDSKSFIKECDQMLKDLEYTTGSKHYNKIDAPFIITPNDFGEIEEYDTVSLTYYIREKVLADENNEPVDDPDKLIGRGSLAKIGRFEDNALHVRNDILKIDFEILVDEGEYENPLDRKKRVSTKKGSVNYSR